MAMKKGVSSGVQKTLRRLSRAAGVDPLAEYVFAAKKRYEEIKTEEQDSVLQRELILKYHITSELHDANVFKVMTRMSHSAHFVRRHLSPSEELRATFLDVGGSSSMFFRLLGVSPENGFVANVLEEHLEDVRRAGYGCIEVQDDRIDAEDDSFNYCLSFECLEHSLNPLTLLGEMLRVARSGVFLSIPHRTSTRIVSKEGSGRPDTQHVFELSPADLAHLASHVGGSVASAEGVPLEKMALSLNPAKLLWRIRAGYGKPNILIAYIRKT